MKVRLKKAERVSQGEAPAGAIVDLPSMEALALLDRHAAEGVSVRAVVTFPAPKAADVPAPAAEVTDAPVSEPVADAAAAPAPAPARAKRGKPQA